MVVIPRLISQMTLSLNVLYQIILELVILVLPTRSIK